MIKPATIHFSQRFQSKVLPTILNAPWFISNYMNHSLCIYQICSKNFTVLSPPTTILLSNLFPLTLILLAHHGDYAGSGPGIFSCECAVGVTWYFNAQKCHYSVTSFTISISDLTYNHIKLLVYFKLKKKLRSTYIHGWTRNG